MLNHDKMISLTKKLSFILAIIFLYWIFAFICNIALDLKLLYAQEWLRIFYRITFGMLALLAISVILHIVLTLAKPGKKKIHAALFILSFPIIIGLLYLVDLGVFRSTEKELLNFAEKIVAENKDIMESLGEYRYDISYFRSVARFLRYLNEDKDIFVELIDKDDEENHFMNVNNYHQEDGLPPKLFLTHYCSEKEHEYLRQVFRGENEDYLFTTDRLYTQLFRLYYPVKTENRLIVLCLSKFSSFIDVESELLYCRPKKGGLLVPY